MLNQNGAFKLIKTGNNITKVYAMPRLVWIAVLCMVLPVFCSTNTTCTAAPPSEDEVKAAFVFNFAKFVDWPADQQTDDFTIAHIGQNPLKGNLQLLENRIVSRRAIRVSELGAEAGNVSLLFIPQAEKHQTAELLSRISDLPVLTVSDAPDFVQNGGMIGLIVVDNKIRFEINLAAAEKAGLRISSQLLRLAREVIK